VIIYGCAGIGKFTPKGAQIATKAVTVAQGLLHALDGFYSDLLTLKVVPDYNVQAVRALSMADMAAATLRAVIAGATVTDEQLNIAAGQVDGAKAILTLKEQTK
jgi:hypothetical protein